MQHEEGAVCSEPAPAGAHQTAGAATPPTAEEPRAAVQDGPQLRRVNKANPFHDATYAMMFFKVLPCPKATAHDWTACPYSHSGEAARRRCLLVHKYAARVCPEMQARGVCPRGQACHMTHGLFEFFMHPVKYKTKMCRSGEACKRHYCFFCHDASELREGTDVPPEWTAELSPAPGGGLSPESVARVLACLPPAATPAAQAALQQLPYVLAARDSELRGPLLQQQQQQPLQQQQHMPGLLPHNPAPPGLVGQMQQLTLGGLGGGGGGGGGMDGCHLSVFQPGHHIGISTPTAQGLGGMPALAMAGGGSMLQLQGGQVFLQQQQHAPMLISSGVGTVGGVGPQAGMLVQPLDGGAGGPPPAYAAAPTSAGAAMQHDGGLVQLQDGGYVMMPDPQAAYPQQFQQPQQQQVQLCMPEQQQLVGAAAHPQDAGALVPAHLQHPPVLTSLPLAHLGAPVMQQDALQQQQQLLQQLIPGQQQQAPGRHVVGTPFPGTAN